MGKDDWDFEDDDMEEDLFEDDDDSSGSGLKRTLDLDVAEDAPPSPDAPVVLADQATISYTEGDADNEVFLNGAVENRREKATEISELLMMVRDQDGKLLDFETTSLGTKFKGTQELVTSFHFTGGALPRAHTVDLLARVEYEFQQRVAIAECEPLDPKNRPRARMSIPLQIKSAPAKPGEPRFRVTVNAWLFFRWDEFGVRVLVELAEETSNTERSAPEMFVALRDEEGKIISKEDCWGNAGPKGYLYGRTVDLSARDLRRFRRIDIGVKGRVERLELLRSYKVRS